MESASSGRVLSDRWRSGSAPVAAGSAAAALGHSSQGPDVPSGSAAPVGRRVHALVLLATAIVAVAAVATSYLLPRWRPEPSPPPAGQIDAQSDSRIQNRLELARSNLQARNYRAAVSFADEVLAIDPTDREAGEIRGEAGAMVDRFDAATADARRLLERNDLAGASRALGVARNIDPIGPGLAELAATLSAAYEKQAQAARKPIAGRSPSSPASSRIARPETPAARSEERAPVAGPPPAPDAAESTAPARPTPPPPVSPLTPAAQEARRDEPVGSTTVAPKPASPRAGSQPPAAQTPQEQAAGSQSPSTPDVDLDDAAIRRIVATYRRAIEAKDLALYRSIKPNMTPADEQAIASGFRAVASQKVDLTILSIEREGSKATVHLARRDTIEASGRHESVESRQTMSLVRESGGWVIVEIR